MKTKITVLCENSVIAPFPLIGEHGFSCLIESGGDATLFDTGQGFGLMHNMKALGMRSDHVRRIILSHGHYDHTGGLIPFLTSRKDKTSVYVHPDAFHHRCKVIQLPAGTIETPIGMSASRSDYENAGAEFIPVQGFVLITESIAAISEVARPADWKTWDTVLKRKINGVIEDDPFNDDLSLLIRTESGPVVLLGCAHAGIVEILNDLSEKTGHREFHAVIGGTHLANAPEDYVGLAMDTLKAYRVRIVAVSHCTGLKMACRFAAEFKNEFANASVGGEFEF
ncbi:MAG: MBL fold metallo-hydrolase [Spirochaetes bacterium]|nr:MBL fold metallo-hydrolase [Spirochaetota bacterium]